MFTDDEITAVLGAYFILAIGKLYLSSHERRFKVRPINRDRQKYGYYRSGFLPMKEQDPGEFFKYTRMNKDLFEKLCNYLRPHLKVKKIFPDLISVEERVAITLHYLSQGSSLQTIAWKYHMGRSTVRKIVNDTCDAIWTELEPQYLTAPTSASEWKQISDDFYNKWNFPNCLGALDGKHINIQAPAHSGSLYFNYKKTFSVVLLAAVDANYKFLLVDIGAYGSQSDGGIFRASHFGQALDANDLNVPKSRCLPQSGIECPFVFVGDEAFPLKDYIFRPYPGRRLERRQKIFNYRLSRARRIVENAFGIMVARWRILKNALVADVKMVDKIVKAVVVLHNFLQTENAIQYSPRGYADTGDEDDGQWRQDTAPLAGVGRLATNNAARSSFKHRDAMADYFLSPAGEVPWQYARADEGRIIL